MTEKILVIDDETGILRLMSLILEKYQVETCESVDNALLVLEKQKFDLIISDIKMPGKDGYDLVAAIEKVCPNTPVILMTGHADRSSIGPHSSNVTRAALIKPFEDEELLDLIAEILHS